MRFYFRLFLECYIFVEFLGSDIFLCIFSMSYKNKNLE